MPVDGVVSSDFGWRTHPISGKRRFHEGMDIAAPTGTEVRAVQSGTVRFAGTKGGYGNVVELEHGDGTVTRYAHASRLHVRRGDKIEVGESIADVGQTGHATGPHLHFQVEREGEAVDPVDYLSALRANR
jgi:murein DD-endopeptidase MepM/ murein hydrolase activator NlpD